jgi:hypothetical protein
MLMHQSESVVRGAVGAASLTAAGGGGGGVFLDPFAGGLGVVDVQVADAFRVGVSGGGGTSFPDERATAKGLPRRLYSGRLFGQWRPRHADWLSVGFGLGGGAFDTGYVWGTGDVGVTFGYTFLRIVRPYAGAAFALSQPLRPGPGMRGSDGDAFRTPSTTLYGDLLAGVAVRVVGAFEVAGEFHCDLGWSQPQNVLAYLGTLAVRYTFGPIR